MIFGHSASRFIYYWSEMNLSWSSKVKEQLFGLQTQLQTWQKSVGRIANFWINIPKAYTIFLERLCTQIWTINSYMFEILTATVFLQFKNTFSCLNLRLKTESLQLNLGMIHFVHWWTSCIVYSFVLILYLS